MKDETVALIKRVANGDRGAIQPLADVLANDDEERAAWHESGIGENVHMAWTGDRRRSAAALRPIFKSLGQ